MSSPPESGPSVPRRLWQHFTSGTQEWFRALGDDLYQFWFAPADAVSLDVLRWFAGAMLLYTHIVWGFKFDLFLGEHGFQTREMVALWQRDQWCLSFWWMVPTAWQWAVHNACLAILFCNLIGFLTPIMRWLTVIITISYANRAPLANYGLDQINTILAVYLAVAPTGSYFSVDRMLTRLFAWWNNVLTQSNQPVLLPALDWRAQLAMRLIQVHLCVIYLFAGLSKLQGDSWWTGEAVWLAAANLEYQSRDLTWLAWYPWLAHLATITTIFWECTFWALVWRPRWRLLMLTVGTLMHLGIGGFLGMWTFGLMMPFSYMAFLPATWVHYLMGLATRSTNILAEPAMRIVIAPPITLAQHLVLAGRKLFDIRNQIEVDWSAEPIVLKPATIVVHAETASAQVQTDQQKSSSPTSEFADELLVEPVEIATLASDDEPYYLEPAPSMVASTHARTVVLFGKPTNDLAAIGKYLTTKGRSTIHKRSLHRVLSYLEADESSIVVMFAYQFKSPEATEILEKLLAFRQPMLVLVNRQQADSLAMFASADVRLLSSPTSGRQLIHALNELPLHDQGEAQESLELPDVLALEDQNNQVRQFPLADVVTT